MNGIQIDFNEKGISKIASIFLQGIKIEEKIENIDNLNLFENLLKNIIIKNKNN